MTSTAPSKANTTMSDTYTISEPQFIEVDTLLSSSTCTINSKNSNNNKIEIACQVLTPIDPEAQKRIPCLMIRGWQSVKEDCKFTMQLT